MESVRKFLGNETRRKLPLTKTRALHDRGEKRNVVADAFEAEFVECFRHRLDRRVPRRCMRTELGYHRIVIDGDFAAFVNAGIVAQRHVSPAALRRRAIAHQPPRRG